MATNKDVLYACAVDEASQRYEIEQENDALRRLVTTWEPDGDDRVRTSVRVFFDPAYGPGVQVIRDREHWQGDGHRDRLRSALASRTKRRRGGLGVG